MTKVANGGGGAVRSKHDPAWRELPRVDRIPPRALAATRPETRPEPPELVQGRVETSENEPLMREIVSPPARTIARPVQKKTEARSMVKVADLLQQLDRRLVPVEVDRLPDKIELLLGLADRLPEAADLLIAVKRDLERVGR